MKLKVKTLISLWDKSVGLLGREHIAPVYFTTRWGIHTFGLRKPIDVVVLDDAMRVQVLRESLPPNSIFLWNPRYKHILELPMHTIALKNIRRGLSITIFSS